MVDTHAQETDAICFEMEQGIDHSVAKVTHENGRMHIELRIGASEHDQYIASKRFGEKELIPGEVGVFQCTIPDTGSTASFDYAFVEENHRGHNIGTRVFQKFRNLAIEHKKAELNVLAYKDNGAYTWARMGVTPRDDSWKNPARDIFYKEIMPKVQHASAQEAQAIAPTVERLKTILEDVEEDVCNPDHLWEVTKMKDIVPGTDTSLGKAVLGGIFCDCYLDLADTVSMQRSDQYIIEKLGSLGTTQHRHQGFADPAAREQAQKSEDVGTSP